MHRSLKNTLDSSLEGFKSPRKREINSCYYEGKTRLYQFHQAYPLMNESENLLKKAYTLLPSQKKKEYYVKKEFKNAPLHVENTTQILLAF